jgi:hypothetical protein
MSAERRLEAAAQSVDDEVLLGNGRNRTAIADLERVVGRRKIQRPVGEKRAVERLLARARFHVTGLRKGIDAIKPSQDPRSLRVAGLICCLLVLVTRPRGSGQQSGDNKR